LKRITYILGALFCVLACHRSSEDRGYEIITDMVHAVPTEAFSESPFIKGKSAMLVPPDHSIARGQWEHPYGNTEADAIRAGKELKNPVPETKESFERGKELFGAFCLVCHGKAGFGDGPLIPKFPNPPAFRSKGVRNHLPGRIFHVITRGWGEMPPHSMQVGAKDRWAIVHYVRSLQGHSSRFAEDDLELWE
jgi:mono/diheme cytochrome c family protein